MCVCGNYVDFYALWDYYYYVFINTKYYEVCVKSKVD